MHYELIEIISDKGKELTHKLTGNEPPKKALVVESENERVKSRFSRIRGFVKKIFSSDKVCKFTSLITMLSRRRWIGAQTILEYQS